MHRIAAILAAVLLLCTAPRLHGQDIRPADRKQYAEALAHYNSHNYRQSAVLLRKVAARNPKAPDPQFWLGMTAVANGFNAAGIRKYFGRCIELAPDYPHPLAHYYMGIVHYTDARYDEAVAELERYFALAEGSDDRQVTAAYEEASNYLYWSQFLAEAMLKEAPFEPGRVTGVSSRHDEILPYLSPDGTEFYYLRRLPVKKERTYYARELEETHWRLCMSRRTDSTFSQGVELPAPFNSGQPEGSVSLTADGRELYYSVITNHQGYANSDLYMVRRDAAGSWSAAERLGQQVNNADSWESQPTVSADGRTLVFASNRRGGHGGTDLWRCHRLPNGDWSRPENLGDKVNTRGNEKMPFLAADGHTLYFLSDGWQGFGGYDIYFADLADPYGNRPTNMGLPLNTEADESGFGVTADGRRAYFAGRLDDSRSSDILAFDLYPAARPEPMTLRHLTLDGADTLLVLHEQEATVVTLTRPGRLPVILNVKPRQLPKTVSLSDSVAAIDLADPAVVDALARWMVDNPRVHLSIECPKADAARQAYDRLRGAGLRADRLAYRGGTDIPRPQIRRR